MRPVADSLFGTVGLRHVLEDAIAMLKNEASVPENRRLVVMEYLRRLFDEASKGSSAAKVRTLLRSADDASAVQSFTFVERYVGQAPSQQQLQAVSAALSATREGRAANPADLAEATSVLSKMLRSMKFSRPALPQSPESPEWLR